MTMLAPIDRRFVLLDRDGTIVVDKVCLCNPEGLEFVPGAIEGLRLMRDFGLRFILITNQSGIIRGYFDEDTLGRIHRRLRQMLAEEGIILEAIYHCPHGPWDGCRCRKPAPGLVLDAMADFCFSPADAVLIGDSDVDMGAAASGVMGIRVVPQNVGAHIKPDAASNFLMAARRAVDYFEGRRAKR